MIRKIKPRKFKKEGGGLEAVGPQREPYPTFYISTDHLPEAKDWKVGSSYKITLVVTQTGISQHKHGDGKEYGSAEFDIKGIEGTTHKELKSVRRYT